MTTHLQPWFAACPKGLESLLASELAALGASGLRETVAGPWLVPEALRARFARPCQLRLIS